MQKHLFAALLLLQGSFHFTGFAKAFGYGEMKNLTILFTNPRVPYGCSPAQSFDG